MNIRTSTEKENHLENDSRDRTIQTINNWDEYDLNDE